MSSFPKSARLKNRPDFERLKSSKSGRVGNRYFAIRWLAASARRLGIVAPKKTGSAPRRNLIKRMVREVFRLEVSLFPAGDILVIAREALSGLKKIEIRKALIDLLEKIKKSS